MKSIKYLLTAIFLISSALADDTGRITGRIIDRLTKEPLAGVNVSLLQTSQGASSAGDGWFLINNVPEGLHRLEFSYAGYQNRIVSDIAVTSFKAAIVNIQMIEEIYEGEKIIVTAG
ncbi:MAG: carboxypeptidase-like regulatory domain-containing protein [Calditrichaceae bacterium]